MTLISYVGGEEWIITIIVIGVIVVAIRLFGAWMFRINEVINNQKELLKELKKITERPTNNKSSVSKLEDLYNLKEKGAISDDEFEKAKNNIIN